MAFRKDCPEGHLERDRFLEIYGAMAPEGADVEHHVDQIFRIFDRDGELHVCIDRLRDLASTSTYSCNLASIDACQSVTTGI